MNRHVNAIAGRLSLRPPQRRSLEILDQLPKAYTGYIYQTKCAAVYQHVYDFYYRQDRSVYAALN